MRVWHAAAESEWQGEFEQQCERLLPPAEREEANRFRRTTSRNQHIVGRAMARKLLGGDAVAPDAIRFTPGKYGKPTVQSPAEADQPFNIAHTDGLVICGVANGPADLVGVDVESLSRDTSPELAKRYFSPPEIDYLDSLHLADRQVCFLRIWTLKEALIKAIGTGLHTPLSDFAFHNVDSDEPTVEFLHSDLADHRSWKFVCFRPREGFIASAAVAVESPRVAVQVDWRPFEGILWSDGLQDPEDL